MDTRTYAQTVLYLQLSLRICAKLSLRICAKRYVRYYIQLFYRSDTRNGN